ncbi:N-acetylmannosamine-6-phosphate 2-epimerase [Candidatus Arthromitus sp. SFB-mouse-Japan]|uniref:N-acetylmannosamine-6-phosphate 2-epimerase n=1 Tax=unclassified Candidatus Neoarthromitus TaxID=2638829 RepID=UPI00021B7D60|nr:MULTISPECIES: N-acetylmannosamine-6-phosphate 2-epimerase [unclassified Candidatus Arthromitus]EIA22317.1 Putative N-acetylmannosamine-6-phosphate 2-epimerase [Candidatus Arthromitus sp. SFB-1]EIA22977.1 Putative N-acetylmannosamine-6-phosphate 2-epimerase [Candidatus Arthromitus sp. SFB-3]EIA23835.1 Putative N-acetylmannosamine-6-phosphate 2-epimerase [Candidatus Arthromitus sp. SFB-2]EIA29454.1 Putative N-acetylmannosamine-6-phosphate 2-epimerase [Candidatus Arthromitus sp. SFB-co]EIA3033
MLNKIKDGLVISCQALYDEPLHSPFIMGRMALAAKEAGAVAIRAQGVSDIIEIKRATNLPVIGIIKRDYEDSDVYITPTIKEVNELLSSGCEMIALDATRRSRPNDEKLKDLILHIKEENILVMADISNYEEGVIAEELGCDCVSTTLSGYTSYTQRIDEPDFELMKRLVKDLRIPVIAEGRINTPEDLKSVYDIGVYSAVVGSAITRPQLIAKKFIDIIKGR